MVVGGSNVVVSVPNPPAQAEAEKEEEEEEANAKSLLKVPDLPPSRRASLGSFISCSHPDGAKSPRRVSFAVTETNQEVPSPNRMLRRRSLADMSMTSSNKCHMTINVVHDDDTYSKGNDDDGVPTSQVHSKQSRNDAQDGVMSTSGDKQRLPSRRRFEAVLLDVNCLQLRSRSPNVQTGDAEPTAYAGVTKPQGWRKVKTLVGSIVQHKEPAAGAGLDRGGGPSPGQVCGCC